MDARSDADLPEPGERAAKARQRIEELRRRRDELAGGEQPSQESVDLAERHAEDAMDRAQKAHLAAAKGHDAAARTHERTANHLQRAAMRGVGNPHRLQDEADAHWQAADDNRRESVEALSEAEDPTESSSAGS